MELITLIFVVTLPIAFLVWALKFKGLLSSLAIAPLMLLMIVVFALNTEASETNPPALQYTHDEIMNQTAVVVGNTTSTYNAYGPVTENIVIGFQNMQIVNYSMMVFVISVSFVIFRRMTREKNVEEA